MGHSRLLKCAAVGLSAVLYAAASTSTIAQVEAQTGADQTDGGEIIVTAQKRSERLQDVPVSISAFSGDAVKDQRITSADDLAAKLPNMQVSSTVGEGTPIFSLRGISMSDFSLNQSGPVATYYDEVYKGNFALLGVALYDLERIEVLRGPQGTLYGKNTTGGAVNLISAAPQHNLEAAASAGLGNYGRVEASGMLNVPLSDTVSVRVAGTLARAHGWFDNTLDGAPNMDAVREYGIRGSLLFEPTSNLSFTLRGSTSYQNPYNYGVYGIPTTDGIGAGAFEAFGQGTSYFRPSATDGDRAGALNYTGRRRARTYSIALNSKLDFDNGLSLISVTSWDKGNLAFIEDTDGSPLSVLEIDYTDRAKQFAQDLRIASDWSGPFNFILGAYYNREDVFNESTLGIFRGIDFNGDGGIDDQDCVESFNANDVISCSVTNRFDQRKHSYAIYSDASFEVSDAVTLRAGLRYSHDKGKQTGLRSDVYGIGGDYVATLIDPTDVAFSKGNFSGKIGIDVKPAPDVLLYASFSRGYRAPSFNAQAFFDPAEASVAKAETVNAYEFGWKTQFANNRVTFNGAIFYYDYSNQQFINVENAVVQTLANIESSRIYGAEGEFSIRASDALTLRGGVGLLSTKITDGVLSGVVLDGNKLANAPDFSFNAGIDLALLDDGVNRLSVHPEISYISSQYFDAINSPVLKQAGYMLVGGNIKYERGPVSISVWGKNLTNAFYFTSRIDSSAFGFIYNHLGAPRTYGATLSYEF